MKEQRNRSMEQNRELRNRHTQIQLIFYKGTKELNNGEKIAFSTNSDGHPHVGRFK